MKYFTVHVESLEKAEDVEPEERRAADVHHAIAGRDQREVHKLEKDIRLKNSWAKTQINETFRNETLVSDT